MNSSKCVANYFIEWLSAIKIEALHRGPIVTFDDISSACYVTNRLSCDGVSIVTETQATILEQEYGKKISILTGGIDATALGVDKRQIQLAVERSRSAAE